MAITVNNTRLNTNALYVRDKILMLQKKRGFAWITNKQLGKMLGVSGGYISHQITALCRAGLAYRHIERDSNGEIAYRQLVAFRAAKDTALASEEIKRIEADKTEQGTRIRLIANARNLGISPSAVIRALIKHSADKVDEALCIVKASCTCKHPLKLFWAALVKGYKAGKIAAGLVGSVFKDARRRSVKLPEYKAEEIKQDKTATSVAYAYDDTLTRKEKLAILKGRIKRA